MKDFDKRKMLETLMDPNIAEILAELEDGPKNYSHLAQKLQMSENEIRERLSYVIDHCFVLAKQEENGTTLSVDAEKLNKIMESDENFEGVVDGLTGLDQFLN